jgi:tetraacyldisaccharide 4'-kinase
MRRPLLLPLVPLYAAGLALRELRLNRGWEPVRRLRHPVISIGNLSTGGSGKTPLTITLARLLSAQGFQVDVLSRGYGRQSREAARVQPEGSAEQYGDEPLLIAREAGVPVYVAAERYDAGQLSETDSNQDERRPQVHILDDGFQHRQLHRDIDILLVSRADWHDQLLPAGNLRESLKKFNRATVLAYSADEPEVGSFLTEIIPSDRNSGAPRWIGPVWRLRRRMEIPQIMDPIVAFCGIARPEQFFAGLRATGLRLAGQTAFKDHHRYTQRDVESLIVAARSAGATALITTEKDEIRLGALASRFLPSLALKTARLSLSIENESQVSEWLASRLETNRPLQSL